MANAIPTPLSSLTYDGTDLQRSDLSVHLEITLGLNDGLDVRGEDSVVPGATGRIPRSREGDVRHLQLAGWVQGVGTTEAARLADWQSLRDELEALFDPTRDEATLAGEAWDGTTRTIEARPEPGIIWNQSEIPGVTQLSVALIATDPTWAVSGGGS
jgi:hypothetical protein